MLIQFDLQEALSDAVGGIDKAALAALRDELEQILLEIDAFHEALDDAALTFGVCVCVCMCACVCMYVCVCVRASCVCGCVLLLPMRSIPYKHAHLDKHVAQKDLLNMMPRSPLACVCVPRMSVHVRCFHEIQAS